jgi:Replication-relaxation
MSAYLSRRGLDQLATTLSDRDLSVIRSVHDHRFLTTPQVEQLHFYDHVTEEAGARVCRRILARLVRDRLLTRLERRVGGVRAGSASYVYALGAVGHRLVADGRRFTEPSPLFLDHTLAIADARLDLTLAHRAGELELVQVEIEPASWRRFTGPSGAPALVRPDLYVITRHEDFEDCWFLEIDRGTESPAAIGRKCRAYHAYWRTGREQEKNRAFPLVVWVAPKVARSGRIEKTIKGARNLNRDLFRVSTTDELVRLIAGGAA